MTEEEDRWSNLAWREWYDVIPAKYQIAHPADFDEEEYPGVNSLMSCPWEGIFLSGPTGTGKTHLGTAIMRDAMNPKNPNFCGIMKGETYNYDKSIAWISVPHLLEVIKSTFNGLSGKTSYGVCQEFIKPKILLLDDLGAEKRTDFSLSTVYFIVSERINQMKKTIITTNDSLSVIDKYEPRLASRLASFSTVELPSRDRRLK